MTSPGRRRTPDRPDPSDERAESGPTTEPPGPTEAPQPKITVTRVAASRTRELSGRTVRRIRDASRADGAQESGLTRLIWLNAVQTGADTMIAVALANTIFFSAATSQQRGNVALYLAITMAPFALVAPVIGPLLDRLHHGRRYALAATLIGRAVIAWVMAANFDTIALYPAALGFLVLSKAYGVLKSACLPRVLPPSMDLVTGNARLSIFALASATVFGGVAGGTIKLFGDLWGLRLTGLVFLAGAFLALRLPKRVDSARGESSAHLLRSTAQWKTRRALGPHIVTALRGSGVLRGLSGFLTLFLAFLIKDLYGGTEAIVALSALAIAAGGGSFIGTAVGARMKLAKPEAIVMRCVLGAGAMCILTALLYNLTFAVATALVAGVTNSLAKLSLDAIIQREMPDNLRASAFGRSETLLQLAWVIGGAIGISLPMDGRIGFGVAAAVVAAAFTAMVYYRNLSRSRRKDQQEAEPGPVGP